MKTPTLISLVAVTTVLAGCGGDGDGASRATFDQLNNEYDALDTAIFDSPAAPVFAASGLPSGPAAGGATYDGVISILLFADFEILGDMEVRANFADDTISGGADSFSDSLGATYTGSVDLENGQIFRNPGPGNAALIADFDGQLIYDPTGTLLDVDTIFVGDFYGDNYQYMFGTLRGQINRGGEVLEINDDIDRLGNDVNNADGDAFFVAQR